MKKNRKITVWDSKKTKSQDLTPEEFKLLEMTKEGKICICATKMNLDELKVAKEKLDELGIDFRKCAQAKMRKRNMALNDIKRIRKMVGDIERKTKKYKFENVKQFLDKVEVKINANINEKELLRFSHGISDLRADIMGLRSKYL